MNKNITKKLKKFVKNKIIVEKQVTEQHTNFYTRLKHENEEV